jgi:hypothetical protein
MELFCNDNTKSDTKCHFVKIDNILVREQLKGVQVLYASTTKELLEKIRIRYEFTEDNMKHIQLWSGQLGVPKRVRLDILDVIPTQYETIWIRFVKNVN